jgi:DNA recombination-dependent growth factor C
MGLLKGNPTITRYRILDPLTEEFTDEFIGKRLKKYSFVDIETTNDEISVGWVELLDYLASDFTLESYQYGPNYAFTMRMDTRKLSNKILNRYYAIREAQFVEKNGRKPNAKKKKELKETLRLELLKRTLLTTDLYEVVWLTNTSELWLFASGEKLRITFEELFGQTFGLSMRLIVPITLGLELISDKKRLDLLNIKPSLLGADD